MSGPRIRDKRDRLRQLRAFCEALRRGSISRAAEHLGLTQPAVSLNVRDLEHELGEALLVRTTAGVEPTPAGERLHALADPLVRDADSLLSDFARHLDLAPPDGVRVASSNAGAAFVLPAYLKRFRDAHPDIAVRLDAATVPEGFRRLADDEVDFVVGPRERFDEERIVYRELRTYRIVLITAPDHPLAGRASVSPREAAAHPADGAEMAPALDPRDPLRRLAAGVMRLARLSADAGSGAARHGGRLSLPRQALRVRIGAKGVVTGAKSGLRASGGMDRANRKVREALVTGWYGAATTELPPAAWSAEADVGAERRNQVPLSRSIAMSRADAPPQARRATPDRRRARSTQTARRLPRGFLWPRGDRGTPRD